MRASYAYLPILPARWGQFRAVGELSPVARSRLTPLFDVPAPLLKDGETLEGYLAKRAEGINRCWERDRPVYLDVYNFPLDVRMASGAQPIAYLIEQSRAQGSRPIPVAGIERDRGIEYLKTVRSLAAQLGDGICLRLEREEIVEAELLRESLLSTLDLLRVAPDAVDVVLDFRYVGRDSVDALRATVLEALTIIRTIGTFRNIAIAGGSVPEQLAKRDEGKVRREKRIEFDVWSQIISVEQAPIANSDFGVVNPQYVPPAKIVSPPARVRYTTDMDHIFLRAKRTDRPELCRQLIDFEEYAGARFSVGDQRIALAARGRTRPGTPATWVGQDLNHHLEHVSAQAWTVIKQVGLERRFSLPAARHHPWLQDELLSE